MMFEILLAVSLQLSTSPASPFVPIRVVNVPRLIAESIDGKAATAQLQAFQAEKQRVQADKQAELQRLDQAKALPAQIERAQLELQRVTQDAEVDFAALDQQVQQAFNEKLRPVLNKIAEEEHIGIIFEYPRQLIVWAAPSVDITSKVIERLDAASRDKK